MTETNRQYLLKSRPVGMVGAEHFEFTESPAPVPGDGELLVRNLFISLDPAMRGWLNEGKSYVPPVGIGEVMRAMSVAFISTHVDGIDAETKTDSAVTGTSNAFT